MAAVEGVSPTAEVMDADGGGCSVHSRMRDDAAPACRGSDGDDDGRGGDYGGVVSDVAAYLQP